jgi:hypothetical protein
LTPPVAPADGAREDAPRITEQPPIPAPAPAGHAPLTREVGGASLLFADLRTLFILANEGRCRALDRLFGLPRGDANVLTLIGTVMLAEAAHAKLGRLLHAPAPSPGDMALGTATVKELMLGPAGGSAPGVPMFGALLALVAGGTVVIPATVKTVRGVRTAIRDAGSFLSHRYRHHAAA